MITVHVLVKNEENFIWYAVMSVINYVDKIIIWDSGSTDKKIAIIEEIKRIGGTKVSYKKLSIEYFDEGKVRQEMLNETNEGWFMVLDGDEIWWDKSISELTDFIKEEGEKYESVVVPTVNLVGDIFHYQEKEAGNYNLLGMTGHYSLRAFNTKIPGLHSWGEHGVSGWVDGESRRIQDRKTKHINFIDVPYIHVTHLERTGDALTNKQVFN